MMEQEVGPSTCSRKARRTFVRHRNNTNIVCGISVEHDLNEERNDTITPIDIAGDYYTQGGRNMILDPQYELLRDSQSNSDAARQGVRAVLHGGRRPFDDKKKGVDQRAIIEFTCDPEREGTDTEMDKNEPADDSKDGDDKGKDGDKKEEKRLSGREDKGKCEDSNASLRFCGYEEETVDKDKKARTLRLEWRTKYACEDVQTPDSGSHWGFFTWFIIM